MIFYSLMKFQKKSLNCRRSIWSYFRRNLCRFFRRYRLRNIYKKITEIVKFSPEVIWEAISGWISVEISWGVLSRIPERIFEAIQIKFFKKLKQNFWKKFWEKYLNKPTRNLWWNFWYNLLRYLFKNAAESLHIFLEGISEEILKWTSVEPNG